MKYFSDHSPYPGSLWFESFLIGMTYQLSARSKFLPYTDEHALIVPSIRKFLDYISLMTRYICFCRFDKISAIDEFVKSSDLSSELYNLPTPRLYDYNSCHACMALFVSREFYQHGEIDIELLFQYALSLFQGVKSCKNCVNRARTGCAICQLEQALNKAAPIINRIDDPIIIDESFSNFTENYFRRLDVPSAPFALSDFFYYKSKSC